ncbi:MAG: hypothetical protein NC084_03355 [Bacteroides sp.]|nr:hypothetical protein [Eubacterium sp.]MCM1417555.1 hypothetical protein [Roseburia sp.]MCM1461734.1 hypothetical protein [Bacteroides sp.]
MSKKLKPLLIASGVTLGVLAIAFVAFWIWIHTYYFEITPIEGMTVQNEECPVEEAERLKAEGYVISYPHFHNMTGFNFDNDRHVYAVFNRQCNGYAGQIALEYKNYARLDYTVDVKPNETLTIAFTGTGYFYDDREPVSLDKTFVFDIKDMSPENLPTLIKEE